MLTLIIYGITALVVPGPVATSPLPNATAEHRFEPPFKSNPTGRGTMDLLVNSTITLMLAVWTVIHPNIIETPTILRSLRNKGLSVLTALIAPELIMAQAYREWWEAKKLVHDVLLATSGEILESVIGEGGLLLARAEESVLEKADELKGLNDLKSRIEKGRKALEDLKPNNTIGSEDTATAQARPLDGVDPKLAKGALESIRDIKKAHQHLSEILHHCNRIRDSPPYFKNKFLASSVTPFVRFQFWIKTVCGECPALVGIEFTMEDAFFVQMGGYTFSLAEYPRDQDRTCVIDNELLIDLLRDGVLSASKLSSLRNDISDRSKADAMAKLLVCLQAGWMLINCICRVISGLPVTLLESNVLTHVVFAVFMYGFWWRKPHNVRQPISLSPLFLDEHLCKYLFTKSVAIEMSKGTPSVRAGFAIHNFTLLTGGQETRYSLQIYDPAVPHIQHLPSSDQGHTENIGDDEDLPIVPKKVRNQLRRSIQGTSGESGRISGGIYVYDTTNGYRLRASGSSTRTFYKHFPLTKRDLRTATLAVAEHRDPRFQFLKGSGSRFYRFTPQRSIHYSAFALGGQSDRFVLSFTVCYAIYFAIHTRAWNKTFPSPAEGLLWKISCGFLAGGLLLVWLLQIKECFKSDYARRVREALFKPVTTRSEALEGTEFFSIRRTYILFRTRVIQFFRTRGRKNRGCAEGRPLLRILKVIEVMVANIISKVIVVAPILYIASRVYIIIECFLIIRKLPEGSFKTVPWEDFWPHL